MQFNYKTFQWLFHLVLKIDLTFPGIFIQTNSSKLPPMWFYVTLQKTHCVKNVRIRSFSGPYFPAFGLNTARYTSPYAIQMRENTDQKNSEYRHFSRSDGNHHSSIALWTLSHVTVYAFFFLWNVYFSQT